MNIDLIKYIMKIIAVPMLLLSLILISHGSDDHISIMNVIGFILLIISGSYIIVDAKNNNDEESK
jgi:hypothetical protein|nr:MAG TPA: hypothetical protein [Crassvirales sp.]